MKYQGRITTWKDDKGFGFITPTSGGEQVFVHISAFLNRQRRPLGNELVTYELKTDGKNRVQATAVMLVGDKAVPRVSRGSRFPVLLVIGFIGLIALCVVLGRLPTAVLIVYLAASLVTFVAYALDKSAAQNNRWRTQESTLHLLALLGGWPGALSAQRLLRHKNAKTSFQSTFWITVVLNCAAFGWLLSSTGAKMLRSVLQVI